MPAAMANPLLVSSALGTSISRGDCDALVGAAIEKWFPPDQGAGFAGGCLKGKVVAWDQIVEDENGRTYEGPFFHVRYEDGDEEHLDFCKVQDCLVDENHGKAMKPGKGKIGGKQALSQVYPTNGRAPMEDAEDAPEKKKQKRAAQILAEAPPRFEVHNGSGEQRAGQLFKIRLENFMCHENFEMEFGPHVNFISGRNGSGKSAVLQGIQACLGVRASDTGRSNTLASFIKEGASHSLISVTIHNTGDDAYEPEMYGNQITVERRIGHGSNTFVLKDQNKKKVASGRGALTAMLEALDINASNPVAVLTQDTARTFLAGSASDKKKYDLFMEATLLEQIAERQQASKDRTEEIKSYLSQKKRVLSEEKKQLEELRERVTSLQRVADKREYSVALANAIAWQRVFAYDGILKHLGHKAEVLGPQKLAQLDEMYMAARADAKVLEEELQERKEMLDRVFTEINELSQQSKVIQAGHKNAKQKLVEAERKEQRLAEQIAEKNQQVKDLIASADEDQADYVNMTQKRMDEHQEQMSKVEADIKKVDIALHEALSSKKEMQAVLRQLMEEEDQAQAAETAANEAVKALDRELKITTKSTGSNKVQMFFRDSQAGMKLLQKIDQHQGQFHIKPVGPIGRYLSIRDEKWAVAVERAIGPVMNKILVHNQQDAELLRKLAKESGWDMSQFGCVVKRLDLPPHAGVEKNKPVGVLTLMDVVCCSDPEVETAVGNYLLDACSYERVGLVESYDEGQAVAHGANSCVIKAWMPDGQSFWRKGQTDSAQGPGASNIRPRLVVNMASQIAEMERQLEDEKVALMEARRSLSEIRKHKEEVNNKLNLYGKNCRRLESNKMQLESQRHTMASQQPADVFTENSRSGLEVEINELNKRIQELQQKLSDTHEVKDKALYDEREAWKLFEAKKAECDRLKKKNEKASETLAGQAKALQDAQETADKLASQRASIMKKLEKLEVEKSKHEKERRQSEADAKIWCTEADGKAAIEYAERVTRSRLGEGASDEEVSAAMATDQLELDLAKVIKEIELAETAAGGTLEELELTLKSHEKRYRRDRARYDEVHNMMMVFHKSVHLREQSLKKLDRNTEANVQSRFKHYMSLKGHVGTIKLNRKDCELVMSVTISNQKNQKDSGPVEDLKSLSGGERSFTTVCFIQALGEITDNPFRAMDEFDVFMDAVNRRISMQSLIKFAHDQSHVQFLFLTPQDIAAVEKAKKECEKLYSLDLSHDFIKVVTMQPARDS